ncbi:MAG: hypothetical protein RJA24_116, partial [Pseudomonadota bacterium]
MPNTPLLTLPIHDALLAAAGSG